MSDRILFVLGAFLAVSLLYNISRCFDRLLEEARRIRQALERSSPP